MNERPNLDELLSQIDEAPQRPGSPDYIYVTTSRAIPQCFEWDRTGLATHLAADPRAPFHVWISDIGEAVQVRDAGQYVMPDPGDLLVDILSRALVICVSGWFWSSRAKGEGGSAGPSDDQIQGLRRCVQEYLPRKLIGPWTFGQHAWAGDVLENEVRSLAGQPPLPRRASTNWTWQGPDMRLDSPTQRRDALRILGCTVANDGPHPITSWTAQDQKALLDWQEQAQIERTGWWDVGTVLAVREALAERV